ncbi:MAG: hypothetical protein IT365_00120 [Candidatus Hydrogenedentes bacterium]|nr:hypothetical protein [Candidatus Hydrogenedentota bacterium]
MKTRSARMRVADALLVILWISALLPAMAGEFDAVHRYLPVERQAGIRELQFSFDGYSGYWSADAWSWSTARGLFIQSDPSPIASVWAMEQEIGNQLLLEELWIEHGFIQQLAQHDFAVVEGNTPNPGTISLLCILDRPPLTDELLQSLPKEQQFRRNRAFMVTRDKETLFVLACPTQEELDRLKSYVLKAVEVVRAFDFHRGMAGVQTNHLTITPGYQHSPFSLIAMARTLGCTWIMSSGYNDWMLAAPVREALREVEEPFVWVSGQTVTGGVMYGIDRYPDIQNNTVAQGLDWAAERGGCYFADLSAAGDENSKRYNGYIVSGPGDQDRIAELAAPLVAQTKEIMRGAPTFMVALLEKGAPLSQETLLKALVDRRAVAVYPDGVVVGPPDLRTTMLLLLLEGAVLESRFPGTLALAAEMTPGQLTVDIENNGDAPVQASFSTLASPGIRITAKHTSNENTIKPDITYKRLYSVELLPEASGRNNLVQIVADSEYGQSRALAHLKAPPFVSIHPLLFESAGTLSFPISIWNAGESGRVPVHIAVKQKDTGNTVVEFDREVEAERWKEGRDTVELELAAGDYIAEVSALGVTSSGLIAVRPPNGAASTHEEDLNQDGVPEIVMENDYVRVVVLHTGGRVIEYTLKSNGENIFFKLWPEKPPMHGEVGGVRQFYPFGGLEEFIGYPYIGGHIEYRSEILQAEGDRARVRVWANIHGSEISKIYTLYGGGPLLEARYTFSNMSPSLNTIGINPLFELGKSTGPEDRYYFPEESIVETRPELERYYGRATFPKEGWAAGHDTESDISLVIGYPVDAAIYLHLWNNHPNNTPTPYYYTEIQPWIELNHGTSKYFTYYVLGSVGPWESLLSQFEGLGLVTESKKDVPWQY